MQSAQTLLHMISFLCLITALAIDSFVTSIAYSAEKIKIPPLSALIISTISAAAFGLPMLFGGIIRNYLDAKSASLISFILLAAIGFIELFDFYIKKLIQKRQQQNKNMSKRLNFKFFNFQFILQIYADTAKADADHSHVLSPSEACVLAFALSFDSITAGFGAGFIDLNIPFAVFCCFAINLLAILAGVKIGRMLSKKLKFDLSWVSGVILICIGCSRLLF